MQSPPCMVEKVADRFRLGQKDRREAGVATNHTAVKTRTIAQLQKVRIELQGRAKTVIFSLTP